MLRGLYSAAQGIEMAQQAHRAVAKNLANIDLPGFRSDVVAFHLVETTEQQVGRPGVSHSISYQKEIRQDFTPGPMNQTHRKLDVAIHGDAFFEIDGPSGSLYTRSGVFSINGNGVLSTMAGYPVNGINGPIRIPSDVSPSQITIDRDGVIQANDQQLGQLKLVEFASTDGLKQASGALFESIGDPPVEATNATVQQGYREQSNVNATDEMVRMIVSLRHHEHSQRALREISEAIEKHTEN